MIKNKTKNKDVSTEESNQKCEDTILDVDKPGPDELKITGLEETIEALKKDIEEEKDRKLRVMAEYDNYRRRTQAEMNRIFQSAGERIIKSLLPVIDDFERLFRQDDAQLDIGALNQGVELIYKKLLSVLEAEGVVPIEVKGTQFDVEIHEAVAQVEDPDMDNGCIVAEIEKGYLLRDRIIRHAKVMVNHIPDTSEESEENVEKVDE